MRSSRFALVAGLGLLVAPLSPASGETSRARPAPADGNVAPPVPAAPATISSEVMVLHATNDGSGLDPKIGKVPALGKPPFSSYNSYKLLSHVAQPLTRGQSSLFALPAGRQLQLVYKDVAQPHKHGHPPRYLLTASIQAPAGKGSLPLVEVKANRGEWFWVGGTEYHGGVLFIGIRLP